MRSSGKDAPTARIKLSKKHWTALGQCRKIWALRVYIWGGIRGPIPQIEIRIFALPSSPHPSRSDKQSSMAFGGVALPGSGSVANTNPAHLNGSGGHAGANAAHSKMNGNGNGIGAGEEEKKVTVAGKESSLEQGLSSVHGIVPTLQ